MAKLKLTDTERLFLANQCGILGHLKSDDRYPRRRTAVALRWGVHGKAFDARQGAVCAP